MNTALESPLLMDDMDVARLPWRPVEGCPGVRAKTLWRSPSAVCAVITYQPGAATPGLPHPGAEHHIWVVSGCAAFEGRRLDTGSYVHVPPRVAHPITAVGDTGCTVLQVHDRCLNKPGA
jgi:hypothetical protein